MTAARISLPVALMALALVAAAMGSSFMPLDRIIAALFGQGSRPDTVILWTLRLPRVLMAILAGAGLGIAGVLLQRATRNPLASPGVLGVVDGAAIGVLVFLLVFSNEANALAVSVAWQPIAAIIGALIFAAFVAVLAYRDIARPMTLILYGIALAALANAVVVLLIIAGPVYRASQGLIWLAGSVQSAEWREVWILLAALIGAVPVLAALIRPLDQMHLDDHSARATGLSVNRVRVFALILSVLLTAAMVSIVGGVGFVGLIAPHAARLLFGNRAVWQLTGAALIGAGMVLGADLIVRVLFQPLEVPAGAVTALIGAPYFLFLLIRQGRAHA
ncbi:FecCD family ABC transporter permease [Jannaschia sp. CCS1]|uniref:FecCD family ABC transporter permease n=1 Tax=Jannaschia sp. (strain CCS1) TaxID=290400 RepID=UPI000053C8C4|nr:iron ABC transporter permease [Jannaschia sp. CCS1]ABD55041.1 transport system permease protein [Jannaschia sp. CCS1]